MGQKQFASHNQLTLEPVRTLEYGPGRRMWLLRCVKCGQYYLKGYQQLQDWVEGQGQVRVYYRPVTPNQLHEIDQSLERAWELVQSRPYILWDEQGRLRWWL
jgi:hypothetical protein